MAEATVNNSVGVEVDVNTSTAGTTTSASSWCVPKVSKNSRIPLRETSANVNNSQLIRRLRGNPAKSILKPSKVNAINNNTSTVSVSKQHKSNVTASTTTNINVKKNRKKNTTESTKERLKAQIDATAEETETLTREKKYRDLRRWQRQWRVIMANSVVYFDSFESEHKKDRAKEYLISLGAVIEPFFDSHITLVVTGRQIKPMENLNSNDIMYKALSMNRKVWTYEKLFRFLGNLLSNPLVSPNDQQQQQQLQIQHQHLKENEKLSHLLKEEKLYGPNDRDPNARRDDFHYFKGPYILIYDVYNEYRPIMTREYEKVDEPECGDWPQFRASTNGRCPFLCDTFRSIRKTQTEAITKKVVVIEPTNDEQKQPQQQRQEEEIIDADQYCPTTAVELRSKEMITATVTPVTTSGETSRESAFVSKPSATNTASQQVFNNQKFYSIAASGVNASNFTSNGKSLNYSADNGNNNVKGNGLAATVAQVPSKEVNNLKRKVFERRKTSKTLKKKQQIKPKSGTPVSKAKQKEDRSGFCENCHEQYKDFETHINSKKHKKFALNDSNFRKIDDLILQLKHEALIG